MKRTDGYELYKSMTKAELNDSRYNIEDKDYDFLDMKCAEHKGELNGVLWGMLIGCFCSMIILLVCYLVSYGS